MAAPCLLLTGVPGVGKSTLIQKLLPLLPDACGFYTREVREGNARIGFDMIPLPEGEPVRLATLSRHPLYPREARVGGYRVDVQSLEERIVPRLEAGIRDGKPLVIDEIGPMEIFSAAFCDVVITALDSDLPVLGTVVRRPYRFADEVKLHPRVELITVTRANRDQLAEVLEKRL
jgi:nucleoside-triphosphatase